VSRLNLADRIRRRIVRVPVLVFIHTLFAKGLIFGGWPGWLALCHTASFGGILALTPFA
jgi:hypothetical protein